MEVLENNIDSNDIIMYNVDDIQTIFKISKNQAYNLLHSAGFPTITIGRKLLAPKSKVEKWIDCNVGKQILL